MTKKPCTGTVYIVGGKKWCVGEKKSSKKQSVKLSKKRNLKKNLKRRSTSKKGRK